MYPIRRKHLDKGIVIYDSIPLRTGNVPIYMVWFFAVLLLVLSGVAYRVLAFRLKLVVDTPVELPVPLSDFPKIINKWVGKDVPIPINIQRAARNDDFLNRFFINEASDQWVNVYIAYTAHPRTMLGHRPQICYVAGGWIHEGTELINITTGTGRELPCLLHRFRRPSPETEETVVLNFYIVNGRLTSDETVFSGVGFRTPNIDGDLARYVAQVQISSVYENSVRSAARDITEQVLDFFPDENGKVRAVEYIDTAGEVNDLNTVQITN